MNKETHILLEDAVQEELTNLNVCGKDNEETLERVVHLVELLNEADKIDADRFDKSERRRIEEERNQTTERIERRKQELTIGRVCLEMAKIVVPTMISLIGYGVYQKRLFIFEKDNTIASMAGRELHLPKFMK